MLFVTKSYLPDINQYFELIKKVWHSGHLTNHGPLVNELEESLKDKLGVPYFHYLNNGTIALQIAIKAAGLKGDILTTPFSYVATTSSIVWESCRPVFVDIDPRRLTIDPTKLEAALTPETTGILATHVYGIPCHVEAIEKFAKQHSLKVIYDGAHAFGVRYKGKSLLNYGDISTLSFHATKLFHTIEGGAVITNDENLNHRLSYMRNFGHDGPEAFFDVGINGKSSEFHAAMGLCLIDHIDNIINRRRHLSDLYKEQLASHHVAISYPEIPDGTEYNYSYFPIIFPSEEDLLHAKQKLNSFNIYPRRYFYPSLNTVPYVEYQACPISEDISKRVLCLPLYPDLLDEQVKSLVNKLSSR